MNITLRQIRAFISVAQLGGFTPAADRLHLTQSALSVLIRGLERELRVRLFDRTTRKVQLTEAGRDFYPIAEKTLGDLQSAVASSKELAEKKRGRVTIAATPLISSIVLPKAIARYCANYPGIGVVLRDGTVAGQIQRMVQEGEVDIGIAPAAKSERGLEADAFMIDTLVLACPRGHALTKKARVTWRDLANYPFIALSRDNSVQQLVDDYIASADVKVQPTYEVSHLSTAIGLVDAGLGISVLPSSARAISRLYHIQFRKLGAPTIRREVRLLTRRDRLLSPAAASFKSFLLEFVKKLEHHENE